MKPICAAFLVLMTGVSAARAQGTPSTGGTVNVTQCWDAASRTVKGGMPGVTVTAPSSSPTVGSTASVSSASSANSPQGSTGKGTSPDAAAAVRPSGMPDC